MKFSIGRRLWSCLPAPWLGLLLILPAAANTRTLEFPVALASSPQSQFSTQFRVLSPGRLVVEVVSGAAHPKSTSSVVRLTVTQPDQVEVLRREGPLPLRLEYRTTDQEIERWIQSGRTHWVVKVSNAGAEQGEFKGLLRITVPAAPHPLADTQFTLVGSGNAQEIPFVIPAPGKIQLLVSWETDPLSPNGPQAVSLTLSLTHPGLARTYAKRQGPSALRIEHQATESELDAGSRWVGRIQNDTQSRVRGRMTVLFTPAL
ncbi:MAG: hypothetical protein AB1898_07295 [Acidobacteriota bacterium]